VSRANEHSGPNTDTVALPEYTLCCKMSNAGCADQFENTQLYAHGDVHDCPVTGKMNDYAQRLVFGREQSLADGRHLPPVSRDALRNPRSPNPRAAAFRPEPTTLAAQQVALKIGYRAECGCARSASTRRFDASNMLAARKMGTAKFEPEKSDRTAKFTPITFPLASNTGPPDPP
jgi:hypothetical protein